MKIQLAFGLVFLMACGINAQILTTNADRPPDFSKMSYDEANNTVNSEANLIVARKAKQIGPEYVTNLVYQLRQGNLPDEKKVLVIYLLGVLRPKDTNAIEVLIDYIDLKATRFDPKTDIQRWGLYPAQEALMRIGGAGVSPILAHLPAESNEVRRYLMCDVLKRVEGKETVLNQLKQKLDVESDSTRQVNLEAALQEVSK